MYPGAGDRSRAALLLVHPIKLDARPVRASSVNAMQQQRRSLILADLTAVIASCRNLCIPRRLINKLPLITASVPSFLILFFVRILSDSSFRSTPSHRVIQERVDSAASALEYTISYGICFSRRCRSKP